jgi:hypothetical protein
VAAIGNTAEIDSRGSENNCLPLFLSFALSLSLSLSLPSSSVKLHCIWIPFSKVPFAHSLIRQLCLRVTKCLLLLLLLLLLSIKIPIWSCVNTSRGRDSLKRCCSSSSREAQCDKKGARPICARVNFAHSHSPPLSYIRHTCLRIVTRQRKDFNTRTYVCTPSRACNRSLFP